MDFTAIIKQLSDLYKLYASTQEANTLNTQRLDLQLATAILGEFSQEQLEELYTQLRESGDEYITTSDTKMGVFALLIALITLRNAIGGVSTVSSQAGYTLVDNTDPKNPIILSDISKVSKEGLTTLLTNVSISAITSGGAEIDYNGINVSDNSASSPITLKLVGESGFISVGVDTTSNTVTIDFDQAIKDELTSFGNRLTALENANTLIVDGTCKDNGDGTYTSTFAYRGGTMEDISGWTKNESSGITTFTQTGSEQIYTLAFESNNVQYCVNFNFVTNISAQPTQYALTAPDNNWEVISVSDANFTGTLPMGKIDPALVTLANAQSDWLAADTTSNTFIKNKPAIPETAGTVAQRRILFTQNVNPYLQGTGSITNSDLFFIDGSNATTNLAYADGGGVDFFYCLTPNYNNFGQILNYLVTGVGQITSRTDNTTSWSYAYNVTIINDVLLYNVYNGYYPQQIVEGTDGVHIGGQSVSNAVFAGGVSSRNSGAKLYSNIQIRNENGTGSTSKNYIQESRSDCVGVTAGANAIFAGGQNSNWSEVSTYASSSVDVITFNGTQNSGTTLLNSMFNFAGASAINNAIYYGGSRGSLTNNTAPYYGILCVYNAQGIASLQSNLGYALRMVGGATAGANAIFAGGNSNNATINTVTISTSVGTLSNGVVLPNALDNVTGATATNNAIFVGGRPNSATTVEVTQVLSINSSGNQTIGTSLLNGLSKSDGATASGSAVFIGGRTSDLNVSMSSDVSIRSDDGTGNNYAGLTSPTLLATGATAGANAIFAGGLHNITNNGIDEVKVLNNAGNLSYGLSLVNTPMAIGGANATGTIQPSQNEGLFKVIKQVPAPTDASQVIPLTNTEYYEPLVSMTELQPGQFLGNVQDTANTGSPISIQGDNRYIYLTMDEDDNILNINADATRIGYNTLGMLTINASRAYMGGTGTYTLGLYYTEARSGTGSDTSTSVTKTISPPLGNYSEDINLGNAIIFIQPQYTDASNPNGNTNVMTLTVNALSYPIYYKGAKVSSQSVASAIWNANYVTVFGYDESNEVWNYITGGDMATLLGITGKVNSVTSSYNLVDNTDPTNPKILQDNTKANKTTAVNVSTSTTWSSGNQTLTVDGVTSSNYIAMGIASTATDAQMNAFVLSQMRVVTQETNSITLDCAGTIPSIAIPLTIFIFG